VIPYLGGAIITVSIVMVRVLVQAFERAGGRRDELLAAAAIDPQRLDDAYTRVPLDTYERAQLAALELCGDEALGLHMGEQSSSSAFDVLGHVTEHAPTLRQSLQTVLRYSRIVTDGPESLLCEEGETASIRYAQPSGASRSLRLPVELAMTGLVRLMRMFVGADARPRRVLFEYEAPAYHAEYTRVFGGAECFGQAFTGIELDRAWLDCTQLHKNPELYTALKAQAERTLGRLTRDTDLAELVKQHLAGCEPKHMPSMDEVARHFGMSARSLRRRLFAERWAYKDLVERALAEAAKRMLEDPHTSIHETAYAMGFATPTGFHRAFKRWTGMTPKEHRTSY
jgi:AraC-like DNA-binding protein